MRQAHKRLNAKQVGQQMPFPSPTSLMVIDSLGGTVASTYDGSNFLTERTYSGQSLAMRIDFVNNKEGQPTTETSYSDLAGTSLVATTDIGYNWAGVITSVASYNASSVLIDSFVYSLDSHSNVTKVVETQSGTTTTTSYTYDSGGQLKKAWNPSCSNPAQRSHKRCKVRSKREEQKP